MSPLLTTHKTDPTQNSSSNGCKSKQSYASAAIGPVAKRLPFNLWNSETPTSQGDAICSQNASTRSALRSSATCTTESSTVSRMAKSTLLVFARNLGSHTSCVSGYAMSVRSLSSWSLTATERYRSDRGPGEVRRHGSTVRGDTCLRWEPTQQHLWI